MQEYDKKKILEALSAPMPSNALQKGDKEETKKGYDTIGYGYQFVVNRFNDVLAMDWGYNWEIISKVEGLYKSGRPYYEVTVTLNIWIIAHENLRSCTGGHISGSYFDALKGAITNAFKKTAAFWGVGKAAYEGLDDDRVYPEPDDEKVTKGESCKQSGINEDKNEDKEEAVKTSLQLKEISVWLMEMAGKEKEAAIDLLKLFTTYKEFTGFESTEALGKVKESNPKRFYAIYKKIEGKYQEYIDNLNKNKKYYEEVGI